MQTEDQSLKPNPTLKIALIVGPLFLLLSSAWAMWIWWTRSQEAGPDPRLAMAASEVGVDELNDHLRKLGVLIGPRDWQTPEGRKRMRRAIAFIEGTLSPQNYGFAVKRGESVALGEDRWPTLWVDLKGTEEPTAVVLVAAAYDRSDAVVAAVLCAANDLRDEEFRKSVRFVFFPSALYEGEAGKDVKGVLEAEESFQTVLVPELPGGVAASPAPAPITGTALKPVAQNLVRRVREAAH